MDTDLDMGGHNVDNIASLDAVQINIAQGLEATTLTGASEITGALQAGGLSVSGTAQFIGDVAVVGGMSAGSANIAGDVSASSLEANTAQITGDITSSIVSANTITAATAGLRHLESDLITARQITSSGRGDFQSLSTGSCTGC